MRVVQLVMAPQHRGAELFALQLSRELVKRGDVVRCVAMYQVDANIVDTTGVDWVNLDKSRSGWLNIELLTALRDQLKSFKPDIVQANAGDTLKYVVLVKLLFGLQFKIVFRNASTVSSYLRTTPQRWLYRYLYKRVDYVISVSDYSRKDFVSLFPFIREKIITVPNGLNVAQPHNPIPAFRSEDFNILHVGGFTFEKNHLGLLGIFEKVLKIIPTARLWLVGDGPLRSSVERSISEMNLKNVEMVGSVHNPLDYMTSASVLVLPSIIEGMPGVILEAMLCKTPVVAHRVGGIGELVMTGKTGYLIEPNDVDAFAKAIQDIYQKKPIDMIDAAHTLVVQAFASNIIAKRFATVYQKLITQ